MNERHHHLPDRAISGLDPARQSLIIAQYERILPVLRLLLSKRDIYERNRTWPGTSPTGKAATQLISQIGRKALRTTIRTYAQAHNEDRNELIQLCEAYCRYGPIGLAEGGSSDVPPLIPEHLRELADFVRLGKHPRANSGIFIRALLDRYADELNLSRLPTLVSRYAFAQAQKTERWFLGENEKSERLSKTTRRLNLNVGYPHRSWQIMISPLDVRCSLSHRQPGEIYPHLIWSVDEYSQSLMGFHLCPAHPTSHDILLCYRWSIWHFGAPWWKARGVPELLHIPSEYCSLVEAPDADRALYYTHCQLLPTTENQMHTSRFVGFPDTFTAWLSTIQNVPTLQELRIRLLNYLHDGSATTFAAATPTPLLKQQVSLPWSTGIAAALLLPSAGSHTVQQRQIWPFGVPFEVVSDEPADGTPVDVRYDPDDARVVLLIYNGAYVIRAYAAAFEHHLTWLDLVDEPAQISV
jgi:hypothetical protein